jgi:thiol:disulfide interchange protein DsbD
MEAKVWSDPVVLKMLKEKFVVVALYADDKTILPEEKWVKSNVDGKIKKTIGDINLDFQICNFGESAQPLYATLDKDENLLQRPISYTDLETFKSFLEESLVEFKKSKRGESPI